MERTSVELFDCSIRPDRLMGSSPLGRRTLERWVKDRRRTPEGNTFRNSMFVRFSHRFETNLKPSVPRHFSYYACKFHYGRVEPDGDEGSLGVFFSETEFHQLLSTYQSMKLEEDVKELVYRLTGGHPGATVDVLLYMKKSETGPPDCSPTWEMKFRLKKWM
jgi:hypothetical protein